MHARTLALTLVTLAAATAQTAWDAPDRGAKVAALIPGRQLPALTPETLYADWTQQQVARWAKDHPNPDWAALDRAAAAAAPTDAELTADFPRHIAPFGRPRSGKPAQADAEGLLIHYCPFCGSRSLSLSYDPANAYHATTTCCRTELYGRPQDMPAGYPLKPTTTVKFRHLDDSFVEVPCTLYRDKQGVEWELYLKTLFDQRRWLQTGCDLVVQLARRFEETADPTLVHKLAVLLDQVADTYYGLPLTWQNELCLGKDGQGLTRAEWEAVPRPAIFEVGALGPWNRRTPIFNRGWINMSREQLWVEPFAQVRHHPVFRAYSQAKYGDPAALDRKVTTRVLREVALMFKCCFSQKLLTNYQEANYADLWLLGVLLQDQVLLDFAGPAQEVAMYNHSYQDGLNGEGAPNYMAMPGGYFYPYLRDPQGWLRFYPRFLADHPFYHAADGELRRLTTVRGLQLEFGDQHEYAFPELATDPAAVRAAEQVGSRNWAGYGVGVLRVGGPGHRQEVGLSYTRASLHNAQDALTLECWVDGVPVMRRGGYGAHWKNAPLQWERPEIAALKRLSYPHPLAQAPTGWDSWSWDYVHSVYSQNGVTVDNQGTGRGWGDNRGYGEVITFKGGEPAGEPGSGFQVLDVRDHYSWWHVGQQVPEFRRTLIAVEGPDGRPYVLDLLKVTGGRHHAFYQSAWADLAEVHLPTAQARADTPAGVVGIKPPADEAMGRAFKQLRGVEQLAKPGATWDLTWKTDVSAWAPRDPATSAPRRTLPDGVGKVRVRLIGVDAGTQPALVRAKGPWIGWLHQPLTNGQQLDGNVSFEDARDFLIETRAANGAQPLSSLFAHVIEGFKEGEPSAIKSVTRLAATRVSGPERDVVALRLELAGGHTDTVIYQSEAGAVKLADGTETDARYALLRRAADGEVTGAEVVRGSILRGGEFAATLPGEFTGTITDVVGDLTGTRQESAVIVQPDRPWPAGELAGRQLLIRVESPLRDPCNEGYRAERATLLPDGKVRVDLQDHAPFVVSWHQVTVLPADKPNVIRTNRPMVDHGNSPWYHGLTIWFPERGKRYTIKTVNEVGGGVGGDFVELVEPANLAADGIKPGDWYVIAAVRPGLKVGLANDFTWRREPAAWRQYVLRATGPATVAAPATHGAVDWRAGDGAWQSAPAGKPAWTGDETRGAARLVAGKPAWLKLNDTTPPALVSLALDGQPVTVDAAKDLGWIQPPKTLAVMLRDGDNPLDPAATAVTLDGVRLDVPAQTTQDGRGVLLELDLAKALAADAARPRRHTIEVTVADQSIGHLRTTVTVAFINRVALETAGVVYLSDLAPVRAAAHGGLIKDHDYVGQVATIAGRVYPKGLTLCPESGAAGGTAEAVYALPKDRTGLRLLAEVGISESAGPRGSATFEVQTGPSADGPWTTLYTSPVMRGEQPPATVDVALGAAQFLRLRTTDAGDGISSDHALWGLVRLK